MAGGLAGFIRRTVPDNGFADDKNGFVGNGLRRRKGFIQFFGIMSVNIFDDMPVSGFKAFGYIFGKPVFYVAVNGNGVAVVKGDEFV